MFITQKAKKFIIPQKQYIYYPGKYIVFVGFNKNFNNSGMPGPASVMYSTHVNANKDIK